ncbi:MAG: hypothetical protein US52_C0041G0003 [candidate division WS6 bacterium GW2011_GWA2_37_6]|uniref:EamA domain-containing protein n=1 Tax=candidate division WS6 bacterium GW2011_GWA2_37_6 TaxID=1619087 RepID=A0A0G0GY01_9BACT|nr:MAG: hypothetical protein US52_C0041G0003 [candidate division WS6 bacterium GW2011_GWA2_37_6]
MSNVVLALVGGIGSMFGYGSSDYYAKTIINKIGDVLSLVYVQLIGAILLFLYFLIDPVLPDFDTWKVITFLSMGFFYSLGYFLLYRAFEIGKMSVVSPISSIYSVLAAIISFVFFAEIFDLNKIIVFVLIVLGVILTSFNLREVKGKISLSDLSKGTFEALGAACIFGVFFPIWDKLIEGDGWIVWLIFLRMHIVVTISVFYLLMQKKNLADFRVKKKLWVRLLLVSVLEVFAFYILSYSLNKVEGYTSIIVAIQSSYSIVTAVFAYILLKERLAMNQYIGVGLIVAGLVLFPLSR